jgi:hypothetical protein
MLSPGVVIENDTKSPRPPRIKLTMSGFWHLCSEYARYYQESALSFWRSMNPGSYTWVLAAVWLIGFLVLKSGARR